MIALLVYVMATHVLRQRRHPAAAISWVLFMLLPCAALPLYVMLRTRRLNRGGHLHSPARTVLTGYDERAWPLQVVGALGSRLRRHITRCASTTVADRVPALISI